MRNIWNCVVSIGKRILEFPCNRIYNSRGNKSTCSSFTLISTLLLRDVLFDWWISKEQTRVLVKVV